LKSQKVLSVILKMKFKPLKQILYILILAILPLLSFSADNTTALFEKGNASYAKAQYKDALAAYQQVLGQGYQSSAIYYNMGNAAYRNGDIPAALLYYEKAHKLNPGDEDINVNIRFANAKTTDKIDESPEFFVTKWWRGFILGFSVNMLALLSIVLFLGGSALLILYFFTNSVAIKKASFYAALGLFLIGLAPIFIAASQVNYFDGHKQAIIFSSTVNVKGGPAEQSVTVFVLHEGTKVNVLDNVHGWLKIKLVNGNQGWMKATDVKEI